jgi:2-polyprenyl-3-methyl-5-hydroxy-6-metoxy-1,4-benzoquinol methylase
MTNIKDYYFEPDAALLARRFTEYKSFFIDKILPTDRSIKILDIGCGFGLFLDACKKCNYENYEGVDGGMSYVEYATLKLGLKNITCSPATEYLKLKENFTYDVITAFNVIEHIKRQEVPELLSLMFDKLKPNGLLIVEVPNGESPLGVSTYFSDLTHEFAYTRHLLRHILYIAGFNDIKVIPRFVNSNIIIRLAQKILAKIIGFDDEIFFTGNIVAIAKK